MKNKDDYWNRVLPLFVFRRSGNVELRRRFSSELATPRQESSHAGSSHHEHRRLLERKRRGDAQPRGRVLQVGQLRRRLAFRPLRQLCEEARPRHVGLCVQPPRREGDRGEPAVDSVALHVGYWQREEDSAVLYAR